MNKAIIVHSKMRETSPTAVENMNGTTTPPLWRCYHRAGGSDIEAWVAAKNGIEIIASARQAEGISARANAELIAQAVNVYEKTKPLIVQLMEALEMCLACKLNWEAEQEADIALRRARTVVGKINPQ